MSKSYGLILFLIVMFIVAILAELTGHQLLKSNYRSNMRLFLMGNYDTNYLPKKVSHATLGYIVSPGYSIGDVEIHNMDGYRGNAVSFHKDPDTYRILFLGGSTTYSWAVETPDSTFPEQTLISLDNYSIADSNGKPIHIEVMNGGLPWGTSAEMVTHYLFKYRYYKPDLTVIHTGGNDAMAYYRSAFDYQPDYSHWRNAFGYLERPKAPIKWLYKSRMFSAIMIYTRYKDYFNSSLHVHGGHRMPADWYRDTLYMSEPEQNGFYVNIRTLINEIHSDGGEALLVPFIYNKEDISVIPEYEEGIIWNNELLEILAKEENVQICGITPGIIPSVEYWMDDCHLFEAGTRIKGAAVAECIHDLILSDK